MSDAKFVVVITGLPRSGTSAMMQTLAAGGVAPLTDLARQADMDNPRGYFELEAVKKIATDNSFLDAARGKAVKIIHTLLAHLPLDRDYRVILMRRDLDEVLASQRKMLTRRGHSGAALNEAQLKAVYQNQLLQTMRWLAAHSERVRFLEVEYKKLVTAPRATAREVNAFLGGALDEEAMAAAVDPSLYRNSG